MFLSEALKREVHVRFPNSPAMPLFSSIPEVYNFYNNGRVACKRVVIREPLSHALIKMFGYPLGQAPEFLEHDAKLSFEQAQELVGKANFTGLRFTKHLNSCLGRLIMHFGMTLVGYSIENNQMVLWLTNDVSFETLSILDNIDVYGTSFELLITDKGYFTVQAEKAFNQVMFKEHPRPEVEATVNSSAWGCFRHLIIES